MGGSVLRTKRPIIRRTGAGINRPSSSATAVEEREVEILGETWTGEEQRHLGAATHLGLRLRGQRGNRRGAI